MQRFFLADTSPGGRRQYAALGAVSLGVVALSAGLQVGREGEIQRYLSGIPPLVAALVLVALCFVLLTALRARGPLAIVAGSRLGGIFYPCGLAGLFGAIVIAADLIIVYPRETNAPFPQSLLFYPVIGYFAEVVFHLIPLTVLLLLLDRVLGPPRHNLSRWLSMGATALIEPIYQTLSMASLNQYPPWALAFNAIHILLIGVSQLWVFKRFGFLSMYLLRITYYLVWHIGWGHLRLSVLF